MTDFRNKIATSKSAETAKWCHLRDSDNNLLFADGPDGKPDKNSPCRILLRGKDCADYQRAKAIILNKHLSEAAKAGRKAPETFEELEEKGVGLIVAVTVQIENISFDRPLTAADAKELYEEIPDVFEQAKDYVEDRSNFLGGVLVA